MNTLYRLLFLFALILPARAQHEVATPWVEMIPEDLVVETNDGQDQAVKVIRKRVAAWQPGMGQLLGVRFEVDANYGESTALGVQTPFAYSVEQLGGTALSGYNGTYGSVTMLAVGDQLAGGLGAWIGMCGGTNLTAFDGNADGAGTSGHTTGNQIGPWSQTTQWNWPAVPQQCIGGVDGSGTVPVTMLLTAQGFVSQWNAPGHYMRKWKTRASVSGERALSCKVRLVYTVL